MSRPRQAIPDRMPVLVDDDLLLMATAGRSRRWR